MKNKPSISIIVPIYNEQDNINELYKRLKATIDTETTQYEIIFVDDGSKDDSVSKIKSLKEIDSNIKIVVLSRNYGHQIALSAGLDASKFEVVITMDADLQHPPELIPQMLDRWRKGAEIVVMARTEAGDRGIVKAFFTRIFYKLMFYISNVELDPNVGDFRLVTRRVANAVCSMKEKTRFLRGLVKWTGFNYIKLDYEVGKRFAGNPTYTFAKLFKLAISGITSFSTFPLTLAFWLGLVSAFLSLIYAGYAIYAKIVLDKPPPPGWTSVMVIVIFMGSIQLISLGMIGEYIAKIYNEVKNRPLYIVKEMIGFENSN